MNQISERACSFGEACECWTFFEKLHKEHPLNYVFAKSFRVIDETFHSEFSTQINGKWVVPPRENFYRIGEIVVKTVFNGMSRDAINRRVPLLPTLKRIIDSSKTNHSFDPDSLVDALKGYSLYYEKSLVEFKRVCLDAASFHDLNKGGIRISGLHNSKNGLLTLTTFYYDQDLNKCGFHYMLIKDWAKFESLFGSSPKGVLEYFERNGLTAPNEIERKSEAKYSSLAELVMSLKEEDDSDKSNPELEKHPYYCNSEYNETNAAYALQNLGYPFLIYKRNNGASYFIKVDYYIVYINKKEDIVEEKIIYDALGKLMINGQRYPSLDIYYKIKMNPFVDAKLHQPLRELVEQGNADIVNQETPSYTTPTLLIYGAQEYGGYYYIQTPYFP